MLKHAAAARTHIIVNGYSEDNFKVQAHGDEFTDTLN